MSVFDSGDPIMSKEAEAFLAGVGATFLAELVIAWFLVHDYRVHREATLPQTCSNGQQILMTSAPTAELYVWVRK